MLSSSPTLKSAIRLSVRATPLLRKRKSAKYAIEDVLPQLIVTCRKGSLRDVRDKAVLMAAFAFGEGRRNEIAGLPNQKLQREDPIHFDGAPALP